jgi:predicted nucleotide-binding protein
MSIITTELFEIADQLDSIKNKFDAPEIKKPLERLQDAANEVGKAWSGSWLGYHSRVYYRNLQPPPPGARFSQEWGLMNVAFIDDTRGDWLEFDYEALEKAIYAEANYPDPDSISELAKKARSTFEDKRAEVLSTLSTALAEREDTFIDKLKNQTEQMKVLYASDFATMYQPKGQIICRDMVAIGQGMQTPAHIGVLSRVMSFRSSAQVCEELAKIARQGASHLAKRERYKRKEKEIGTNIFIGHGRSLLWKDLKDFIQDRLGLPWDEFNRIPVAGITNIARLSQMLDDAAIALLIMTAEDEQTDGKLQARMNVVHEAGLFQGKLGFTKAIVLLEEGCEEFSNIQGLGQIRFPKGNIKAAFEEVRQVLEREDAL